MFGLCGLEVGDTAVQTKNALKKFQIRYRPSLIDGEIDAETIYILSCVINAMITECPKN